MAGISIPGLTVTSNPNNQIKAGSSISLGGGAPLPVTSTAPRPAQQRSVLGASTARAVATPNQTAGPASPNYINNAPQIPQPQQPSIDFDALIAPALAGLDAAIQPLQDQSNANISGINTNAQNQKNQTNQSI